VIAALEANHMVRLHRATNRNRWHQRLFHLCRTPETGECSMHLANQSRQLV
jgi:hypothetical protein